MTNKKNSIIMLIIILAVIPFMWHSLALNASTDVSTLPKSQTAQAADWSKNVTEQETKNLIAQADMILNQQNNTDSSKENAKTAAAAALNASSPEAVSLMQESYSNTYPAQYNTNQQLPANQSSRANILPGIISAIPGIISLVISCAILVYVNTLLNKNEKAGKHAESLLAEIQDLEINIRQWESENYSSRTEQIDRHILELKEASEKAESINEGVKDTIHKGITLNQKSLEILKKAHKGISSALASQVKKLEDDIAKTANESLNSVVNASQKYISEIKTEKESFVKSLSSKPLAAHSSTESLTGSIAETFNSSSSSSKSTPSMIDIITRELESAKPRSTSSNSSLPPAMSALSHADMLRESIARQKEVISRSSLFSSSQNNIIKDINDKKTPSASETLRSSGLLKGLGDLNPETKPASSETSKKEIKPLQTAAEKSTADDDVKVAENHTPAIPQKDVNPVKSQKEKDLSSLDNKVLMDKLSHAERWKNYIEAAEICEEMTKRTPNKPELYDIWGQMLAKQAANEKGPQAITMLKDAGAKMQKASIIDGQNYKIFNNWGVILKNLALLYTDSREAEKTLALARRKFETSLSLNPQNHEALNNWGNTLMIQARYRTGTLQESLLKSACEKFEEAVSLKNDKDISYYSWGNALFRLANCKKNPGERNKILDEARKRWEQANKLKPGMATKELRVLRSMVPPLEINMPKTFNGKPVEDFKFKTI